MKRWMIVALVLALALTLVPLAAAAGGGAGHGKNKFDLVGTVITSDDAAGTLAVKVKAGTRTVRTYRGLELALVVDPAARVRLVIGDDCVEAALADVPVGAKVKVRGRIDRTDPASPVFVARDVKAKVPVSPTATPEPADPDEE